MNSLLVRAQSLTEERTIEVAWANGAKQGIINVVFPDGIEPTVTLAELASLHHLLTVRSIYGTDRAGNKLVIVTSSKEVKALAAASHEESELAGHARFLASRFSDARFETSKKDDWIVARARNDVETIQCGSALDDVIAIRGIGTVGLTRHLMEQYRARTNWPSASDAWRSICTLLRSEMWEVPLSEVEAGEYEERHGVVGRLLWSKTTKWMFVLAQRQGEIPRIVTAYYVHKTPKKARPIVGE